MADHRRSFRKRLTDDAVLKNIVGARIDFGLRPQGENLPGLSLSVLSDPRPKHFDGRQGLRQTRYQIDAFGLTVDEVSRAAERCIEILEVPAIVDGVRWESPLFEGPEDSGSQEDALFVHRARLVVLAWHALV